MRMGSAKERVGGSGWVWMLLRVSDVVVSCIELDSRAMRR